MVRFRIAVLIALSAALGSAPAQTAIWRHYSGSINNAIPIQADILAEEDSVAGFYFYERVGRPIQLSGRVAADGKARLAEKDPEGVETGAMVGTFSAGMASFSGSWKSPDGKKSLALFLKEDYAESAGLGAYTVIRSQALDPEDEVGDSPEAVFVGIGLEPRGNVKLKSSIERELFEGKDAYSWMEGKAAAFLADYIDAYADIDGIDPVNPTMAWELTLAVSPVFNARGVLCLEASSGGYSGGAHSNYSSAYFVFDIASGKRLGIERFVRAGAEKELSALLDAEIRRAEGMPKDAPLSSAGFTVDSIEPAEDNFYVDGGGITFYYPPYAIGSYVLGEKRISISWKDLGSLSALHPLSKAK
jgi:hypothetical protein